MVLTLQELRARKARRKKALEEDLEKIKKQLKGMGSLKIILFGSLASGNIRSWSDLDIIAVMPPNRTGKEWMRKIYGEINYQVSCDILAYTEEDLDKSWV